MFTAIRRGIVITSCAAIGTAGCATARMSTGNPSAVVSDRQSVLAEYVQKLPPGTDVRIGRSNGHSMKGTLIKGTDRSVFVQPKTRIAEPIVEIPLADVVQVTPERHGGNSIARAIGAGVAGGAAATVAIFLIMFAVYGD